MAEVSGKQSCRVRRQIIDAFWQLLEDHPMGEITVGMVVGRAGCNRGSFYYHFTNKEELIEAVAYEDLLNDRGIQRDVYAILTATDADDLVGVPSIERLHKTALFMNRGGTELISHEAEQYVSQAWRAVLCPRGGEAKPESMLLVKFCVRAALGLVAHIGECASRGVQVAFPTEYLVNAVNLTIDHIAKIEGVPKQELISRLGLISRYSAASAA